MFGVGVGGCYSIGDESYGQFSVANIQFEGLKSHVKIHGMVSWTVVNPSCFWRLVLQSVFRVSTRQYSKRGSQIRCPNTQKCVSSQGMYACKNSKPQGLDYLLKLELLKTDPAASFSSFLGLSSPRRSARRGSNGSTAAYYTMLWYAVIWYTVLY